MPQENLDLTSSQASGPVECLGQTFPSDEARREHYTGLLREKLKDPEFRKIEGFPIGEDDDILNLSDPPYYTACPNPWIGEFIEHHGRPYDSAENVKHLPYASDVSEGKNSKIYRAHSYHTKVPPAAIEPFINYYTSPKDLILDAFSGSGMSGIAARSSDRNIILCDLSPAATFITEQYNNFPDIDKLKAGLKTLIEETSSRCSHLYKTTDKAGKQRDINYCILSEVFFCPECSSEFTYWHLQKNKNACLECKANLQNKKSLVRKIAHTKKTEVVPVSIHYKVGTSHHSHPASDAEIKKFLELDYLEIPFDYPSFKMMHSDPPWGEYFRAGYHQGYNRVSDFYTKRNLYTISCMWFLIDELKLPSFLQFVVTSILSMRCSLRMPYREGGRSAGAINNLAIPSLIQEYNPIEVLKRKGKAFLSTYTEIKPRRAKPWITTQSSSNLGQIPINSFDFIFIDPPFGNNIIYSELNFLWESWFRVFSQTTPEAIISKHGNKNTATYGTLMQKCFREMYRVLKPGRWIVIEFSNTQASVWNAIQTSLQEVGFIVSNVAALDKKQGSYKAVSTPTAVKQDLVISAYKPTDQLELQFQKDINTDRSAWTFIESHLTRLPVLKYTQNKLGYITERDPRILYDRMVSFYVAHNTPVPLSSAEFQAELTEQYPERDGMFFLHEQVTEYDKKAAQMENLGQMSIFVEDEKSAINWLRNHLKAKPSSYQDIQPEFMKQIQAGMKKQELMPDLRVLLEQNFIKYDGTGDVPSQIHGYLSTNFKNLRGKEKDDASLQAKAKDRWYVPDPKKAVDVEAVRNKRLLTEFWSYLPAGYTPPQSADGKQIIIPGLEDKAKAKSKAKKLKEVRTEAVRVGFAHCFKQQDYATILAVAEQLPVNVVEEDEQLQMIYDVAEMRSE